MKTRILFSFTESVIPPRCRKPRLVTRNDGEVDVEITELTREQAPVAIRASGTTLTRDLAFAYDLRWWDGQLWTPVSLDSNGEPRGRTSGQDNWDWPALPEVLDLRQGGRNQCYTYEFHGTFGSNPREEVEAEIQAFAKRHVVIDGIPHRVAPEPRYVVMTFGLGSNHGGTAVMVDSHFNTNIRTESYFGLLELEAALVYATKVAQERRDTKNLPMQYHGTKFEVLMPEVVTVRNPLVQKSQMFCEFGTAPEQALAGYRLTGTVVGTEVELQQRYGSQDVRLVRSPGGPDEDGRHQFSLMVMQPVRQMRCACCGGSTRGRQWHNQDTGWGLCVSCVDYCKPRFQDGEFERTYGARGVHFDIPA